MIHRATSGTPPYSVIFSNTSFQKPSQPNRPLFAGDIVSASVAPRTRCGALLCTLHKYLQADATLHRLTELSPSRLRKMGNIKGIIFDLDDTLIPLLSGHLSPETVHSLKRLKKAGFQMGIVSNNIQPAYCEMVRQKLAEAGLTMPFIEDARKPLSFGFETMRNHFGLKPAQTVVVGDGLLSDIMGAKLLGMKTIRARWHTNNYYLKWEPFLSLWDSLTILVNYVRVKAFTQRQPQLTGLCIR